MTDTDATTQTAEGLRAAALALHAASEAGDFETVLAAFDPDVVWVNDAGAGPWAGRYEGIDAVAGMFAEFLGFFEGTFVQEVVDVCTSDDRAVVVHQEWGEHGGHTFENRAVWVHRYEGGRIVEVWTFDVDRDAGAAFWAAVRP